MRGCLIGDDRQIKDYDGIVARKGATAFREGSGIKRLLGEVGWTSRRSRVL